MRSARTAASVLLLALAVAACGSSSTSSEPDGGTLPSGGGSGDSTPSPTEPSEATVATSEPTSAAATTTASPSTTVARPTADRVPLCADVDRLVSEEVGTESIDLPDDVVQAIVDWGQANPDRFGGFWIDREAAGVLVVGTTGDVDAIRAELLALATADGATIADSGLAFDVMPTKINEVDVQRTMDIAIAAVETSGYELGGAGWGVLTQRVELFVIDPTEQTLVDLLDVADPQLTCVEGPLVDPDRRIWMPGDELDAIPDTADVTSLDDDQEVICNGRRYRLGDLRSAQNLADLGRPDIEEALDAFLPQVGQAGLWDADDWLLVSEDDERLTLFGVRDGGVFLIGLERIPTGWTFGGSSSGGGCDVLEWPLPEGLGGVEWQFESDPPPADATSFTVLATEMACASGRQLGDQLLGPDVVESDDAIRITFAAIPLSGGADCPTNPPTAVTIELDEPVGDRSIVDGRALDASLFDVLPDR